MVSLPGDPDSPPRRPQPVFPGESPGGAVQGRLWKDRAARPGLRLPDRTHVRRSPAGLRRPDSRGALARARRTPTTPGAPGRRRARGLGDAGRRTLGTRRTRPHARVDAHARSRRTQSPRCAGTHGRAQPPAARGHSLRASCWGRDGRRSRYRGSREVTLGGPGAAVPKGVSRGPSGEQGKYRAEPRPPSAPTAAPSPRPVLFAREGSWPHAGRGGPSAHTNDPQREGAR